MREISKKFNEKSRGIALLMSVFISSAASLLGLGVFLMLYGQLGISGTAKGSVVAFYAADSGLECALYGDLVDNRFSTSSPEAISNTVVINCNGSSQPVVTTLANPDGDSDMDEGVFKFDYQVSSGSCVSITVQKLVSGQTILSSFGENIPDCSISTTRAVQRGLEVSY